MIHKSLTVEVFTLVLELFSYCGEKKQNTNFFQITFFRKSNNMVVQLRQRQICCPSLGQEFSAESDFSKVRW